MVKGKGRKEQPQTKGAIKKRGPTVSENICEAGEEEGC